MRFATVILLAGILVSEVLVTSRYRHNVEIAGMFLAQRDATTEEAKFHWIATDCRARVLDFRTLDEAENHKPLYLGVRGVNGPDNALLTAFQGCQCIAVNRHNFL
jgi:hypothetical protein